MQNSARKRLEIVVAPVIVAEIELLGKILHSKIKGTNVKSARGGVFGEGVTLRGGRGSRISTLAIPHAYIQHDTHRRPTHPYPTAQQHHFFAPKREGEKKSETDVQHIRTETHSKLTKH